LFVERVSVRINFGAGLCTLMNPDYFSQSHTPSKITSAPTRHLKTVFYLVEQLYFFSGKCHTQLLCIGPLSIRHSVWGRVCYGRWRRGTVFDD